MRPLVIGVLCAAALPADPAPAQDETTQTIEEEVRHNILTQQVDDHTVADFNLPERFVERVADRIIQITYRHSAYVVVPDDDTPAITADDAGPKPRFGRWPLVLGLLASLGVAAWALLGLRRKGGRS